MYVRLNFFIIIMIILLICSLNFIFIDILYYRDGRLNIDNFKKIEYPKNIRVAVCYSGQLREGFYQVLNLHKFFIIDALKADVFCYFEDTDDEIIKSDVINLLKPKEIIFESKESNTPDKINNVNYGTISMYKKIYMSNLLRKKYEQENNFNYDYIIRIRPDLVIKEYLPKYIFTENNDINLYIPSDKINNSLRPEMCADWMAIGKNYSMDIYSNMYNYLINNKNNKCNIPEKMMYKYIVDNKLNYIPLYDFFEFPFCIYRFKFDNIDNFISQISYHISLYDRYFNNEC